jgi:adenylosuccinate synthase
VTKLDVLDGFDPIKVVTGYCLPDGSTLDTFPADSELAESMEPIYDELPGWSEPTEGVVIEGDLPAEAASYLAYLEEKIGAPAVIVSTGPRREETLIRGDSALADQLRSIIGA